MNRYDEQWAREANKRCLSKETKSSKEAAEYGSSFLCYENRDAYFLNAGYKQVGEATLHKTNHSNHINRISKDKVVKMSSSYKPPYFI